MVLCERRAPGWALVLSCGVSGLMMPPWLAAARGMWSAVVGKSDLKRAYALTSILGDVSYVAGPALAGVIAAVSSTASLLVCTALAALAGSLLALVAPERTPERPGERRRRSLLASVRLRVLLVVSVGIGFSMGTLEVAVPASAIHWNARSWAGVLLGAFAAGSLVGSLWYGGRKSRRAADESYLIAVSLLALSLLSPALAGSPAALAAFLVLGGLCYGPSTIALFEALDLLAPENATEALSWVTMAELFGSAGGAMAAGVVATRIAPWTPFAIAAAVLFVPAVFGLAIVRRYRARESPPD
jgi:predicted MFS family arabinose efflux permease